MYPNVNQNIVIELVGEDKIYRSMVAEVREQDILISFPMEEKSILPEGTVVEISFILDDSKYQFDTQIIGKTVDNIPLYRVQKPDDHKVKKIQRRDNFRVNANLKIKVNQNELTTLNISAGGLLFTCPMDTAIALGDMISGELFVPNKDNSQLEPISFKGSVRRIDPLQHLGKNKVGLEFINMQHKDEAKLFQYCADKQRQMRIKK